MDGVVGGADDSMILDDEARIDEVALVESEGLEGVDRGNGCALQQAQQAQDESGETAAADARPVSLFGLLALAPQSV
jgi:hypothetical protein